MTPTKKAILKDLYTEILSFAKKHVTNTGKKVYRIYSRSNSPLRNVEIKVFDELIREGYVKKTHENLYIITFKGNQIFSKL